MDLNERMKRTLDQFRDFIGRIDTPDSDFAIFCLDIDGEYQPVTIHQIKPDGKFYVIGESLSDIMHVFAISNLCLRPEIHHLQNLAREKNYWIKPLTDLVKVPNNPFTTPYYICASSRLAKERGVVSDGN